MISEDLRRSYLLRAQALEDSTRRLISEILQHLPPDGRREYRQALSDRLELLFGGVEDAVTHDPDDARWMRERQISRIQELSDLMISTKAAFERERRRLERDAGDVDFDERRAHVRQAMSELDAEQSEE